MLAGSGRTQVGHAGSAIRVVLRLERSGPMLIRRGNMLAEIARRNRQEIIKAGLSRREMFKLGLLTSGGYLVAKKGLSARASYADDNDTCSSPPTRAFYDLLPT